MTDDEQFDKEVAAADRRDKVAAYRRSRDAALFASSWRGNIASAIRPRPIERPSVGIIEQDDEHTLFAFYRGKVNWLYGSNDSCKTWIVYMVALERLKRAECAVIIDFEMGASDVRARMVELGASDADLSRLLVVNPLTGLSEEALRELEASIAELPDKLSAIVFDAAASSIMTSGLDSNVARDVESWVQQGPRWAANNWPTAAVFVVDHTPKEGKEPTGSKRKSDTADAVYYVESRARISRDEYGSSWVTVKKDRQGFLAYELLFVFEGGGHEPWSIRAPKPSELKAGKARASETDKRALIHDVIAENRRGRTPMESLKSQLKGTGAGSGDEIGKRVVSMANEGILDYIQRQGIAPGPKFDD